MVTERQPAPSRRLQRLLDAVILMDHLNGVVAATEYLSSQDWAEVCVSPITRAEVLAGARDAEVAHVSVLLDGFTCLAVDANTADRAAAIRRDTPIWLPDAFQAALAETHGLQLVTRNTRDFYPQRFALVETPYRIDDRPAIRAEPDRIVVLPIRSSWHR